LIDTGFILLAFQRFGFNFLLDDYGFLDLDWIDVLCINQLLTQKYSVTASGAMALLLNFSIMVFTEMIVKQRSK
jgi:hypothetical protein